MDIEKLKESLKKNGIEDEKIEKIVVDFVKEDETPSDDNKTDKPQEDGNQENAVPPTPDNVVPPEDNPDGNNAGNPTEEGVVPPDGAVPPVPPDENSVLPPDVPPTDVTTNEPPTLPPFDPTELIAKLDDAFGQIEELKKTIEGLDARNKSLEDALKNAGVLEPADNENNIGVGGAVIPSSGSKEADSAIVSALARLNHKH